MEVKVSSQGRQNLYNVNDNSGISTQDTQENVKINVSETNSIDKDKGVTVEEAKKATEKINKLLEDKSTHIEYEQDKDFKSVMIMKVVDNNTKQVLNEIPSKQILDMISQFCQMAGLVLDKKA